jgi:hypothetical protein
MLKLFSYGSLYNKDVQLKEFGQEFIVEDYLDYVHGWDIINIKIDGHFYKMAVEGNENIVLTGAIVNVPKDIIKNIDEYEGLEYMRVEVKTLCDVNCIMYVKRVDK